jgi:ATP-dependent DNA helicase DinG
MLELDDIFGAQGPLERALADFTPRPQQVHMADRVARAIESREVLVIEAGTGTGKTFAYLVPALLSGARVLISTGTRTLQDQLFSKDLPLVAGALGRPARVALLKGRANYLCLHRLELIGRQREIDGFARQDATLARIERWARVTRAGDLAEVPGLSDTHPLWPQVTSTRDNCLGMHCTQIARCHVAAARRQAQEADIVIVNHHLLLADLALKEDGFGDLLGSADAVILDEAHQLPDLATELFGANVASRRIENLLQAIAQENIGAVKASLACAEEALRELSARLPAPGGGRARAAPSASRGRPTVSTRMEWEMCGPALASATESLAAALEELGGVLETTGDSPGAAALGARARGVAGELARIAAVDDLEGVRSIELTARGFAMHLIPFDIAERFRALTRARRSAWVFTSATLSVGEDFSHFTARLGIGDATTLRIGSPFDFERQSLLFLPPGLPDPASPGHVAAVLDVALPLIDAARGGAFLLFTSHRALGEAAALLRSRWGEAPPYRLYVQGESPREQLLQDFRADGDGVLLGTASFWEGVDVKGDALRVVVIDKLPFASPEDPLVKARIDHIQATGGNPFRDFQLPEAALALKQGVGRLIRSESDFGAVVICDRRLIERAYGRTLLAALPPMRGTRDLEEARRFLRTHAPARAGQRPASVAAR